MKKNKKNKRWKNRGLLVGLIRFVILISVGMLYFIYFIIKNLHNFIGNTFMKLPRLTRVLTIYTLIACAGFGLIIPYFTNDKVQNAAIKTTHQLKLDKEELKTVYGKYKPKPKPKPKVVSKPAIETPTQPINASVSDYQNYAHNLVINTYGWSEHDFDCLVKLWTRESSWRADAHNTSSGAHGIPQSLPASKMASEGSDYYTNGYTQIRWGLKYIAGRYGTPSNAWAHSEKHGWY